MVRKLFTLQKIVFNVKKRLYPFKIKKYYNKMYSFFELSADRYSGDILKQVNVFKLIHYH